MCLLVYVSSCLRIFLTICLSCICVFLVYHSSCVFLLLVYVFFSSTCISCITSAFLSICLLVYVPSCLCVFLSIYLSCLCVLLSFCLLSKIIRKIYKTQQEGKTIGIFYSTMDPLTIIFGKISQPPPPVIFNPWASLIEIDLTTLSYALSWNLTSVWNDALFLGHLILEKKLRISIM